MPGLRIRKANLAKLEFRYSLEVITLVTLIIGLFTFKDYGIATDERQQRLIGLVNSKFVYEEVLNFSSLEIFQNVPKLSNFGDAIFGSIYENVLIAIEVTIGITQVDTIFETRHLLNHAFFIVVTYLFSKKVSALFGGQLFGVLCILLFFLNPRIYADSFYNTKDIVHMCAFMLGFLSIARYVAKQNLINLTWVTFATVFAINTRMTGVLLIFIFFCTLLNVYIKQKRSIKFLTFSLLIYFVQTTALTILTFPFLWSNPIKNFLITIMKFARYPLDLDMNYWGNTINSESLPWHYFFSWFLISNPITVTIISSFSILFCFIHIGKKIIGNINLTKVPFMTLHLIIFFSALISVIVLNSSLYNGWRHLFFIYPSLSYLCLSAIKIMQKELQIKQNIVIATILISLLPTFTWMVNFHPYGNIYFNNLYSNNVQKKFDVDYWGTTNKEILQRLASFEDEEKIKIFLLSDSAMVKTLESIDKNLSSRFVLVDRVEDADFLIDNFLVDRRAQAIIRPGDFEIRDRLEISNYLAAIIFQRISKK